MNSIKLFLREEDKEVFEDVSSGMPFKTGIKNAKYSEHNCPKGEIVLSYILIEPGLMGKINKEFILGRIMSTHLKINKLLVDYPKGVILVYPDSPRPSCRGDRWGTKMKDYTGYSDQESLKELSWKDLFKNRIYNSFKNYEELVENCDGCLEKGIILYEVSGPFGF